MNNALIFKGLGSSIKSDVSNCRIKTVIKNNNGRLIYLELGGFEVSKNSPIYYKDYNIATYIDYCFYCDSKWDERRNYSSAFSSLVREHFEYNKNNILEFVNNKLNCSFDNVEIINDNSIRIHDTNKPLCDCSKSGYKPFKEIEINISELDNIKPILDYRNKGFARYKISYDFVKELPFLKNWINERTERDKQAFPKFNYYASLYWDEKGIIRSMEISARQNFCSMGLGAEQLESVIQNIKTQAWEDKRNEYKQSSSF